MLSARAAVADAADAPVVAVVVAVIVVVVAVPLSVVRKIELRTFAPIVSAHPYCARESHATSCHVMHRARALSTKINK